MTESALDPLRGPTSAQPTLRTDQLITFGENARRAVVPRWLMLLGLIAAQGLFARFMSEMPVLGLAQAAAIVGVTLHAAMARNFTRILLVIAYIPATEITWRQAQVSLPYLVSPYMLIAIAFIAIGAMHSNITRPARSAIFYFLLLIPSCVITISVAGDAARQPIAFALAGPATLAALVILLSQVHIDVAQYRKMLWVMLISGVGPLSIALTSISTYIVNTGKLEFTDASNSISSGGFGPVQVSAVMGFTVLAAVLLYLVETEFLAKILAGLIGVWAATQSFLTFSRGGMFATALALGALVIAQARDPVSRRRVIAVVIVVFTVGYFLVVPWVDHFTSGQFEKRFKDTQSGRTELAASDVEIFQHNFWFGVGPGMSKYRRLSFEICMIRSDKCANEGSSHTEFTRMLSEHGIEGLISIILLVGLMAQALRRAGPSRAVNLTFLVWAVAQMFYANLRVSAVPIAFALAFLRIERPVRPQRDPNEPVTVSSRDLQTVLPARDRTAPADLFALD